MISTHAARSLDDCPLVMLNVCAGMLHEFVRGLQGVAPPHMTPQARILQRHGYAHMCGCEATTVSSDSVIWDSQMYCTLTFL